MTATLLNVNADESDLSLRARHSIITFLANSIDKLEGSMTIRGNELTDASLELLFEADKDTGTIKHLSQLQKTNNFLEINQQHNVCFKSISFEKINSEINFLRGNLTINHITKSIELEVRIASIENENDSKKALVEIAGKINRQDFDLNMNTELNYKSSKTNQFINVTANIAFTTT
jgi:polyisoprenoid-binding protein YceI